MGIKDRLRIENLYNEEDVLNKQIEIIKVFYKKRKIYKKRIMN